MSPAGYDLDRWKGQGAEIKFEPGDFEVLDLVLHLIPELRICGLAVKQARAAKVKYPITKVDEVVRLLESKTLEVAGHLITEKDVRVYLPPEFFPIEHEGDLVSKTYIGLLRCNRDVQLASSISPEVLAIAEQLGIHR